MTALYHRNNYRKTNEHYNRRPPLSMVLVYPGFQAGCRSQGLAVEFVSLNFMTPMAWSSGGGNSAAVQDAAAVG